MKSYSISKHNLRKNLSYGFWKKVMIRTKSLVLKNLSLVFRNRYINFNSAQIWRFNNWKTWWWLRNIPWFWKKRLVNFSTYNHKSVPIRPCPLRIQALDLYCISQTFWVTLLRYYKRLLEIISNRYDISWVNRLLWIKWFVVTISSIPTRIRRYVVIKSPHIYKHSREHFEIRYHKNIFALNAITIDAYFNFLLSPSKMHTGVIHITFEYWIKFERHMVAIYPSSRWLGVSSIEEFVC